MAPTVPTVEPSDVLAGDSWTWTVTDPTFPPSEGWVLTYQFHGAGTFALDSTEITGDTSTDVYTISVPTTKTADIPTGSYRWISVFTKASTSEKYSGTRYGTCVVRENPELYGQDQTEAEIQLAAWRACRDAIRDSHVGEYTIHGRTFKYQDIKYVNRMIGIYSDQVRSERQAAKDGKASFGRQIRVQFTRPM